MEAAVPKPPWLKVRAGDRKAFSEIRDTLKELGVRTVCDPSKCPNICECWSKKSATFLILGETCTRNCRFCSVKKGGPGDVLEPDEPRRVADAVRKLGLEHAVITSVTRDDLPDQGSSAYASVVRSIREAAPSCTIELLIPDLGGSQRLLEDILLSEPDILGHNIETVERLTPIIRDRRASYRTSLAILEHSKKISPSTLTKSSLMVGLGEDRGEVLQALDDLRSSGVDILTIGQYLRPSPLHIPVSRYVAPEEFAELEKAGYDRGFKHVSCGPFVRSSYRSGESLREIRRKA